MFLHIVEAKYLDDYRVEVVFSNGRKGVADLSEVLHGSVFGALKDKLEFSKMSVDSELETVVWANGADLAPEYIYFQAFKNESELQSQFKQWGYIA